MFSKHRVNILLWFVRRLVFTSKLPGIFRFLEENLSDFGSLHKAEEWSESREDALRDFFSSYQYVELEEKFPKVMKGSHRL